MLSTIPWSFASDIRRGSTNDGAVSAVAADMVLAAVDNARVGRQKSRQVTYPLFRSYKSSAKRTSPMGNDGNRIRIAARVR